MPFTRASALRPSVDIAGTAVPNSALNLNDESAGLGAAISGQSGSTVTVSNLASGIATITGLTGMTSQSIGRCLTLSGAANSNNNGTFSITAFNSATSVNISNSSAFVSDANNGLISWIERAPYSLEDDLNYIRTDRAAMKGGAYNSAIPVYARPDATATNISANLSNLAGKTTDAKALVIDRKINQVAISSGSSFVQISSVGNLKHATSANRIGVPVFDGADAGWYDATYVNITDAYTGAGLQILSGGYAGKTIFGRTRAGSAISPNSVEVEFRATSGYDLSSSVPYTWEDGQSASVNLIYGYRYRLDQIDDTALRSQITNPSGLSEYQHRSLRQLIHFIQDGPADGFASGAYKEIVGYPFPSTATWYVDNTKTKKIVQVSYVRNSAQCATQITWDMYDLDGTTILHTVVDTITYYCNIFETSRTRNIV